MRVAAGIFKNRELKSPKGDKTRPTTSKIRTSVFNILHHQLPEASFLDLFAGSGAMGIEALSQGVKKATFVEKDKLAASCIRTNLSSLQIEGEVIQMDVLSAITRFIKQQLYFDIIYIDPPYSFDPHPILQNVASILSKEGIVILEQGKGAHLHVDFLTQIDERSFGDTRLFFYTHLK